VRDFDAKRICHRRDGIHGPGADHGAGAARESAWRLGLVTLAQMVGALVRSIENPANGVRILGVAEIRANEVS